MPDPTIGVQRVFWSKNIKKGVPYSNGSGYTSAEMDALLEAAQVEGNAAKRREIFNKVQAVAMTDLPIIPIINRSPRQCLQQAARSISPTTSRACSALSLRSPGRRSKSVAMGRSCCGGSPRRSSASRRRDRSFSSSMGMTRALGRGRSRGRSSGSSRTRCRRRSSSPSSRRAMRSRSTSRRTARSSSSSSPRPPKPSPKSQ